MNNDRKILNLFMKVNKVEDAQYANRRRWLVIILVYEQQSIIDIK